MFPPRSQLQMGSAIIDLWRLLLSKKEQEKITIQEANLLMKWQSQTLRNPIIAFSGAATVSMLVTPRRLNFFVRGSLSLGASIVCALWNFGRALESWNDHILSLEGSRMQRELANIMLNRYRYDPWVLQRLSKHFYLEEVYEDSSADKPKFLWQSRYFYGDPASDFQNTSYDEIKSTDSSKNNVEKTTVDSKEVYVNTATDDSQNPFDFVFGLPGSAENNPPSKTSSASPGRSSLRERRSRRRHRRRHQEDSEV